MLFSNFDSFLRGQGVGVMDFFFSPAQCHPDPKLRGGSLSDRDVCFLAQEAEPNRVPDNGALQQNKCVHTPSAVQ